MKSLKLILLFLALGWAWSDARPLAAATTYTQPMLLTSFDPTANTYWIAYYDFYSGASVTIPNYAYLEYDVYVAPDSADFSGGIDLKGSIGNLRDFTSATNQYIRDQNYLRAHPYSDLSHYAQGTWYHRKFDMGAAAGKNFTEAALAHDTGNSSNGAPANLAGDYNAYFDNVKFTNAYGEVLLDLFSNAGTLGLPGAPVSSSTLFSGAGAATATNNLVAIAQGLSLAVSGSPAAVGTAMTITATMLGPGGSPIAGVHVRLSASRNSDVLNPSSGVTDASGNLTATVVSTVSGSTSLSAAAGPFSASSSGTFNALVASSWRLDAPNETFVIGPGAGSVLQVAAKDVYNNVTSTSRVVKISSTDANLKLSTDGVHFVSAPTGVTVSPSAGFVTFTVQIASGGIRTATLSATDFVGGGGALTSDSDTIYINPAAATALSLYLPSNGTAGSALLLSATALDASSNPAFSSATVSFSSASATGAFSLDGGYTWASVTSVALADGGIALLYHDTKAGLSQVNASSSLSNPSASTTILAGAPYAVAGSANPTAVYNNVANGSNVSVISALVSDAYGNAVSNCAVAFAILTNATGASLSSASVNTNSSGSASDNYTVGSTASSANYVRATVGSLRPALINVTAVKPARLNLSPNPATAGANVPTLFTINAQDVASTAAITGPSSSVIALASTTAAMQFSLDGSTNWQSTLNVTLSSGTGQFYARDPNPTDALGATITATDTTTTLTQGVAELYIFQAKLQVYQVSSPDLNVTRGETGVPVTLYAINTGGTDANITATALSFNGGTTNFTATYSGSYPVVVPAGGTVSLNFTVTVGAAAPLGPTPVTLNGSIGGADAYSGAILNDNGTTAITGSWIVSGPATQIKIYETATTPVAGVPFGVTVVALDALGNTVGNFASGLTLSARLDASPLITATGQVNTSYPAFSRGVASFTTDYTLVQGIFLRADAGTFTVASAGITPVAAALAEYRVYNPVSAIMGQPFAVTISAMDQYGNTRSAAAAVTITPNGGTGTLAVAWENLTSGLVSFITESYNLAQTISLFANDSSITSKLSETTPIAIFSFTSTVTPSITQTATPTATRTMTPTFTPTATPTDTRTDTMTATPSPSFSPSPTASGTPTVTVSPSSTVSPTISVTFSESPTPNTSSTITKTPTISQTVTRTPSATRTATVTRTFTRTPTVVVSQTFSMTPSISPTWTVSPTISPTFTISQTFTPVAETVMQPAYPNPFRPLKGEVLNVPYAVSGSGTTHLKLYNMAGEKVRTLVEATGANGSYVAHWDARNDMGDLVASGLYLLVFESGGNVSRSLIAVIK